MMMVATGSAQVQFAAQAVGTSTSQTVNVTVSGSATVNAVRVLTVGTQGLDFQAAGTFNCAALTCTQPVTFTPLYPGLRVGAVVALDSGNNVLGTTYITGTGTGGLGVLIPGTATTIAGDGDWKSVGDNESATSTELFLPAAVALDGAGNLFIADSSHNRIRIVCAETGSVFPGITCNNVGYIYTVAGASGTPGYAGDGQSSISGTVELATPSGIAIDGAGNLYVADTSNHVVREISATTGIITTIAGTGSRGFSGDGAAATSALLHSPTGVAVDPSGNVFVADSDNNRIRVVCGGSSPVLGVSCSAGNIVTVAGSSAAGLGDGGAATAAMLSAPYTITLDSAGNLYIADSGNSRVRAVCAAGSTTLLGVSCSAAGIIHTVAGNGTETFSGDGGQAIKAALFAPSGVAVDPAGNLYIADTQNFRIRKVSSGGIITSIAGTGVGSFGGDGGSATLAGIYGPYGLTLDGSGNLFIAEFLDNRVRKIQANLGTASLKNPPVRQGSTSATMNFIVENDGTGALDLTAIQAGTNSATDPAATTCSASTQLTPDAQCVIGAVFAPAAKPTLSSNQTESGNISVTNETVAGTAGSNSPLVIQVTGIATPVNSTTVTLSSSKNPSSFGQSVTFTATVATGLGTGALSGTVNFYNGTTKLQSGVVLNASGVAAFSTASLPVGLDSITATYNEDGKDLLHFGSTSDPLPQVVEENTAVTLVSSANPSALNAPVTFTAHISAIGGGITPDGTVNFLDGGVTLGTVTVAAGVATFTTSTLADGQHSITAVYSGDLNNNINGSSSAVLKQDVLAGSTVALTSNPASTSVYGTSVTFTATVTGSTTTTPSGTVNFLDGATTLGAATLNAGVATFTTSSLNAGAHAISAAYLGDLHSGPGTSASLALTVTPNSTTTSLAAAPSPGIAGKPITLTATVKLTAGSARTTGTITFTDGTVTLGTATLGAGGTASIAPLLAPGTHAIMASYGGDANDAGSSSTPLALQVNLATTAVSLTSSGSPALVLSTVTFTAVVTGNGGTPTGSLVFSVDGAAAGTVTLDATGKAAFNDSSLAVGSHTISASYSGDTNDNPSTSSAFTEAVQAISTATSLGTATTGGTSPQTVLVATVVGATGPTPTGTVTFMNGAATIGSATLDSNGVGTLLPDLAPSTYNITAQYSGDTVHSASTSAAVKISGAPSGFGVTVNPATISIATSQNTTVKVSVNSTNGFADTIGLGCGTLPAAVNCHFSSASVSLKAGGTATVELTIDTNAPLAGGATAMNSTGRGGLSLAGLFLPAGLFLGCIGWRFRKRNPMFLVAVLMLLLTGSMIVTGCGTGFSQKTAAPGTYTIEVNAVGTNTNITHYQNIQLTVTK